jgi:hypothetical protein
MAARDPNRPPDDGTAPVKTATEARQGRPAGVVRYIMYTSIALALIGMYLVYLYVSSTGG